MNRDRVADLLTDWLEEQPARAPDQLLQTILTDLQRTPQRGRWRASLRRFTMLGTPAMKVAVAGVAVVLVAAAALLFFSGRVPDIGPQPSVTPTPIAPPATNNPTPGRPTEGPTAWPTAECESPAAPTETRVTEIETDGFPGYVVFAACSFWTATSEGKVVRIDPTTSEVMATIDVASPSALAGGAMGPVAVNGEEIWAAVRNPSSETRLVRIDPATNAVAEEFDTAFAPYNMLILDGRAWLADFGTNRVGVYDLDTGELVETIRLANGPVQIDAGFGAVWGRDGERLARIDANSFEVTHYEVPGRAIYVTVGATGVWSASPEGGIFKLSPGGELLANITTEAEPVRSALMDGYVYIASQLTGPDRTELLRIDEAAGEVLERLEATPGWPEHVSAAGGSIWLAMEHEERQLLVRYEVAAP